MEVGSGGQRRVATICCPGGGRRGDGGSLPVPTTGLPPSHRPRIDATVGFHQHDLKLNLIKLFIWHFSPVCQNMAKKKLCIERKRKLWQQNLTDFHRLSFFHTVCSIPFCTQNLPKSATNISWVLLGNYSLHPESFYGLYLKKT